MPQLFTSKRRCSRIRDKSTTLDSVIISVFADSSYFSSNGFTPVLPSVLIYHTALAEVGAGKPKSAFKLFVSVWPFYRDNPRIWLRIAECCVQNTCAESPSLSEFELNAWRTVEALIGVKDYRATVTIACNTEFAAYILHLVGSSLEPNYVCLWN